MPQSGIHYAYIIIFAHLCPHSPELCNIGLTHTNFSLSELYVSALSEW